MVMVVNYCFLGVDFEMILCEGFVQHSLTFIIQLFGCMMGHDYCEMYPALVAQKTVNTNSCCKFHLFSQSHLFT